MAAASSAAIIIHTHPGDCDIIIVCFRSISRKISAQCDLGDEIDFSELALEDGDEDKSDSLDKSSSNGDKESGVSNGGVKSVTRRESRGVSQVSSWSLSSSSSMVMAKCADFPQIMFGSWTAICVSRNLFLSHNSG